MYGVDRSLRVLVGDDELWQRALASKERIDFRALTNLSVCQWKWKDSNNKFTIFRRHVESVDPSQKLLKTAHEVLAAGEIRCSLPELTNILRSTTDRSHNATMAGLYKKDFIYGSNVHTASSKGCSDNPDDEQLTVKTAAFVRSNILARNEQWCFLEHFKRNETQDGFVITISSMPSTELRFGKADSDRVDEIHGTIAGYLVEKVPNENIMRVLFYAQYDDSDGAVKGKASRKHMKSRLTFLAKGATRLPDVVRRRRLGAQTFADRAAFVAKNTRCICCTKSLHLFSKKKRCYLCGYFVCDKDWSIQSVETRQASRLPACALAASSASSPPQVLPNPPNLPSPSTSMAVYLQDALRTSSESKKKSVKSVIKHLVGQEAEKAREGSSSFSHQGTLTDTSAENEYHAALDAYLKVDEVPLEDCVLANAESRKYGIDIPEDPKGEVAPNWPIPENENERLNTIERNHLNKIGNTDEFNIIASLAARELECYASLITVITEGEQLVLGANLEDLQKLQLPRTQAFCSHTILDDKPLVIPHPEADVRFQNFIPVKHLGAKFYCGFPIVSNDNTVVGSVCCLDLKTHEVTQAQYATMKKLAATASKVMQLKGTEIESRIRAASLK
uniref:GAF domain-containing protein n=1 Tax=Globisporangium ultimum (strain ATCC 200006 / CBS 805.95 / DAOM BR144) TaxID=431595 RepID=K3W8E5_GLOUD